MFDPALPLGGPVAGDRLPILRRLVAERRFDDAFRLTLEDIVRVPPADIRAMVGTPDWTRQAALMSDALRELEAIDSLAADPRAYASIVAPTTLIMGEDSPEHPFHDASRALARVLPHVQVRVLQGQGHMGMVSAPADFARLLGACLSS
jgi:pimeloyl-ACP methyl ester carboxylesterase